ncbi:MAG: DUF2723 domain-containing protein [Deltaproteobacteria bacterium]|nr:DUF2723 domain-containing protein [Deltaproteobacteria bacterium]
MRRFFARPGCLAVLLCLAALTLYMFSAFPGVGGRFQAVDPSLHQYYGLLAGPFNSPWHPLYYTLTWLLQWLPPPGSYAEVLFERMLELFDLQNSYAQRVTLFSCVCGALTVAVVFLISYQISTARLASVVATAIFGTGFSFWIQSTEAEVYTLQSLLLALTLLLLMRWSRTGRTLHLLLALFIYTQSFGVTLAVVLALPALLFFSWFTHPAAFRSSRVALWTAFFLGLVALQYLLCYPRGWQGQHLAWGIGDPPDFRSFMSAVNGDVFRGSLFEFSLQELLFDRVPTLFWLWNREFLGFGWIVTIAGLGVLFYQRSVYAWTLTLGIIATFLFGACYAVYDVEVFLLTAWIFAAPAMAVGLKSIFEKFCAPWATLSQGLAGALWFWAVVYLSLPALRAARWEGSPDVVFKRFISKLEASSVLVNNSGRGAWGLTQRFRALFLGDPEIWPPQSTYLEPDQNETYLKRTLPDPNVELPKALLRQAAFYVVEPGPSGDEECKVEKISTSLKEIVDSMSEEDLLLFVWTGEDGPRRTLTPAEKRTLRRVGLKGTNLKHKYYLGIGCKAPDCEGVEFTKWYAPFSYSTQLPLVTNGAAGSKSIRFEAQAFGSEADLVLSLDGTDLLRAYQRGYEEGFPQTRSGRGFQLRAVSDLVLRQGSFAAVVDGKNGRVKSRFYTKHPSRSLPSFQVGASYCKVSARNFDQGGIIKMGSAAAKPYLGLGFGSSRIWEERSVVPSLGSKSNLFLPFLEPKGRYSLRLLFGAAGDRNGLTMTIRINGKAVREVGFQKEGIIKQVLDLEPSTLRPGINQVDFEYTRARSWYEQSEGVIKDYWPRAVVFYEVAVEPHSYAAAKTGKSISTEVARRK